MRTYNCTSNDPAILALAAHHHARLAALPKKAFRTYVDWATGKPVQVPGNGACYVPNHYAMLMNTADFHVEGADRAFWHVEASQESTDLYCGSDLVFSQPTNRSYNPSGAYHAVRDYIEARDAAMCADLEDLESGRFTLV